MLTISHRGDCREAVENTIDAFDRALRLGVDGVETDVRMTADHQCVLFHDRQISDGRAVIELKYQELCEVAGCSVPTLEDALNWSDQLLWVLELKDSQATECFVEALKPFVASRRLLVISFLHNAITEIQRQMNVECAVSVTHRPTDFLTSQLSKWPTIVWRYEFVDQALIQESAATGHRNIVYHVKGIAEHRRCFELGVDGIITDEPGLVLASEASITADVTRSTPSNSQTNQ
jgi:glycerophosphoryl diester phosphodiesterase